MRQALGALAVALAVLLAVAGGGMVTVAHAQETPEADLARWETEAAAAEEALASAKASTRAFEDLRVKIVAWRATFDPLRDANAAQIASVRDQIADLGTPPEDPDLEAPAIAQKRKELTVQLAELQAPGSEAAAAYRRADGIIKRIDILIRERQASELLRLMPTPVNPLHWPSAGAVLTQGIKTLSTEIESAWASPANRADLRNRAPAIIVLVLLALLLMWRSPGYIGRQSLRMQSRSSGARTRYVVAALLSLGQVIVPVVGMAMVTVAVNLSAMTGPRLVALVAALPSVALAFFGTRWLGYWIFAEEKDGGAGLTDRPAEARFLVTMMGLVSALEVFREAFATDVRPPLSHAAQAVWLTPLVIVMAVFTFRLGQLLRRQRTLPEGGGEDTLLRNRIVGIVGTAMVVVALAAPLLAAIGYVTAANALIWPLVRTLGLAGLLLQVQRLLTLIYFAILGVEDRQGKALFPVLAGILLSIAAVPLVLLIWGARASYLAELWTTISAGVQWGETRISPAALLTLIVVFVIGYLATKLVQGVMRSMILPHTRLDKGAQSAAVSGIGYVGLFLAFMVAVTMAGINLSALAVVAGALSVGIGFGLQNIVQNFIAGIILLVERPISEGDLIEVAGKTGTVRAISVRSTRLLTGDQSEIVVPNGEFISGIVTNWTRENLRGRVFMSVTVAYGSDTRLVERLLTGITEDHPLVLLDPPPTAVLALMGPDGLVFEVRAIISDLNFKLSVQSELFHRFIERLEEEGIDIPLGRHRFGFAQPAPGSAGPETAARAPARRRPRKTAAKSPASADPGKINNDPASDPDEQEKP
jgi:small-conductance mechanosensitive channel